MTIDQQQAIIVDEFDQFDDWMDKYALLIEYGNTLPPIDEKLKNPQHLIEGCQSRVWLSASMKDGKLIFEGESDALLVKGITALLIKALSGFTPQEVIDSELYFIDRIGLKEHLSPTRSNGLLAMIKQMKLYAMVFNLKAKK